MGCSRVPPRYKNKRLNLKETNKNLLKTNRNTPPPLFKLRGADLSGAKLLYADLSYASLKNIKLEGAKYNEETRFPWFFSVKGKGMIQCEEDAERVETCATTGS